MCRQAHILKNLNPVPSRRYLKTIVIERLELLYSISLLNGSSSSSLSVSMNRVDSRALNEIIIAFCCSPHTLFFSPLSLSRLQHLPAVSRRTTATSTAAAISADGGPAGDSAGSGHRLSPGCHQPRLTASAASRYSDDTMRPTATAVRFEFTVFNFNSCNSSGDRPRRFFDRRSIGRVCRVHDRQRCVGLLPYEQ